MMKPWKRTAALAAATMMSTCVVAGTSVSQAEARQTTYRYTGHHRTFQSCEKERYYLRQHYKHLGWKPNGSQACSFNGQWFFGIENFYK